MVCNIICSHLVVCCAVCMYVYFPSCRPQRVCVRGGMSDVLTVSNGFPQGCVLSPVLFSIFTNEFTINEENF